MESSKTISNDELKAIKNSAKYLSASLKKRPSETHTFFEDLAKIKSDTTFIGFIEVQILFAIRADGKAPNFDINLVADIKKDWETAKNCFFLTASKELESEIKEHMK